MIWELVGKAVAGLAFGATVAFAWAAIKDHRIRYIAWQKRTQAAMTANRARTQQAAADREICAQLELLPVSEESDD